MKTHICRITTVKAMAVHTPLKLSILNQGTFFKRGQVTLVNTHLTPYLIARFYKTVANSIVNAIRTNIDRESIICMPTILILGRNGNRERIPTVLIEQFMPVVNIEINRFLSLAMQGISVTVCNNGINKQSRLVCHTKVKRSYINRNGDTEIVGIDIGQILLLLCIANSF